MDKIEELKSEISKLSDNALIVAKSRPSFFIHDENLNTLLNKLLNDEIEIRKIDKDKMGWSVVCAGSIRKDYSYKSPLENLKKSLIANFSNSKAVIIDPIGEYEELYKSLCLGKGEIIKLDNSKSGYFNPLDLGIEKGSLDEKEAEFRSLMDSIAKSEIEYMANLFLEMADRQKESIQPDWYNRIVELCNEYLN